MMSDRITSAVLLHFEPAVLDSIEELSQQLWGDGYIEKPHRTKAVRYAVRRMLEERGILINEEAIYFEGGNMADTTTEEEHDNG